MLWPYSFELFAFDPQNKIIALSGLDVGEEDNSGLYIIDFGNAEYRKIADGIWDISFLDLSDKRFLVTEMDRGQSYYLTNDGILSETGFGNVRIEYSPDRRIRLAFKRALVVNLIEDETIRYPGLPVLASSIGEIIWRAVIIHGFYSKRVGICMN